MFHKKKNSSFTSIFTRIGILVLLLFKSNALFKNIDFDFHSPTLYWLDYRNLLCNMETFEIKMIELVWVRGGFEYFESFSRREKLGRKFYKLPTKKKHKVDYPFPTSLPLEQTKNIPKKFLFIHIPQHEKKCPSNRYPYSTVVNWKDTTRKVLNCSTKSVKIYKIVPR